MWRQILADIGSITSLISLGVSIYVALSLRKIKNNYIFRIRAPEFVKAMKKHASSLIEYTNDFENSRQEISVELTKLDVKLRSMHGRMRGESKKAIKQLRLDIAACEKEPDNKDMVYLVYRRTQRVIEEVKETREDINLE